jgi:excinuclease ABC subunit A
VDSIEGLSPAISIEQKTTSHNPRSTVGTITEIYDYMRLLWARAGIPYSPVTGLPIEAQTVSQMVDKILQFEEGTKLILLSPIARGKKGEFKKEFADLQKKGYQRLYIDGEIYNIDELPELNKNQKHDISVVVDRIIVKKGIETRLSQSIETALKLSGGLLHVENMQDKSHTTFSSKFACPVSGFTIEEIEPRLFSFNNPQGACPKCAGLGASLYMDPELIVPNENLSLANGAIAPWSVSSHSMFYRQTLDSLCQYLEISNKTP